MNYRVTYSKAVAIILMVIGHSACSIPYFTQTLYMFHMPLFFFMSGFCFKDKYLAAPMTFVGKRLKGVYWPYVKWSILFLLLHNIFFDIHIYDADYCFRGWYIKPYTMDEILRNVPNLLLYMKGHDQLLGGYWFMKALFYSSLIAFGCLYLADRIKINAVPSICLKMAMGGGNTSSRYSNEPFPLENRIP